MVELSIVVPVYNEEGAILPVLDELVRFKRDFEARYDNGREVELILVDDGSTDRTAELLADSPHPKRVITQRNSGYGAALKRGFSEAQGAWLGFLDADGTYPVEAFFEMYEQARAAKTDLVIGSRLNEVSGMPAIRNIGNRSFAALLGVTSGSKVSDIASGMRLFPRERTRAMLELPNGLDFTPAMTTWALHDGWTVQEVPIAYRERIGDSKLDVVRDGLRFTYDILSISSLYNPLKVFGGVGLLLIVAGIALALQPAIGYAQIRQVPETAIYRLLTALVLWVVGLQSIVAGVVGTSIARVLHQRSLRATALERLLLSPAITRRLHWLVLVLIGAALALNARGLAEYLSNGTVSEHWSRVLTGVVLILTSVHLLLYEILVAYLSALEKRFVIQAR